MKPDNPNDFMPTREEVISLILKEAQFDAPGTERVTLLDALNRYCAHEVRATYDLPNMRTSQMDGIAFRYDDLVAAKGDYSDWTEGKDYVFSNTGIAIPEEFDTVLRIEDVDFVEGKLCLSALPENKGDKTIPPGANLKQGSVIVEAYQRLSPAHIGFLAMGGHPTLEVIKRPLVTIIPSGNELVPVAMTPPKGKNIESNSFLLSAKTLSWGGQPQVSRIVPDDPDLLLETLQEAARVSDIVVFNAGSSKGTDDFAVSVLEKAGTLFFHRVSYGPGHHTSFAMIGSTPVLGLVGPPTGADFNADFYLRPLIDAYYQQEYQTPPQVTARVLNTLDGGPKMQFYARGILTRGQTGLEVSLVKFGKLKQTYLEANCYIRFDPSSERPSVGDMIAVELREPYDLSLIG